MPVETKLGRRSLLALIVLAASSVSSSVTLAQPPTHSFKWPKGKRFALSLSFDDARASQVHAGTALLDRYGVKATFYVIPKDVEKNLEGWKQAVASGDEIANHTLYHPCSGNYPWAHASALEDYTLERMKQEILEANRRIKDLLGVTPESFAYPCGQKFVGRGAGTQSYVPLAASLFVSSRGWLDDEPNDPNYVDLAQVTGIESDGKDFAQILPLVEASKKSGLWLVLAGHEMGKAGEHTTSLEMLEQLIRYAQDPANRVWLAPVGTIARFVRAERKY